MIFYIGIPALDPDFQSRDSESRDPSYKVGIPTYKQSRGSDLHSRDSDFKSQDPELKLGSRDKNITQVAIMGNCIVASLFPEKFLRGNTLLFL